MSISEQKRQEAIEFFKKIGLFITFVDPDDPNVSEEEKEKSVELYHGRIRTANEQPGTWFVDPEYRMAGGAKAGRRDLSTTRSIGFAEGFADKMVAINDAKGIEVTPEIYKIVPTVENALIINYNFDKDKLSEEDKKKFDEYAPWLVAGRISEYAPVRFEDKDMACAVFEYVRIYRENLGLEYLTNQDVEKIFLDVSKKIPGVSKQLVKDIIGAVNARKLILEYPEIAVDNFMDGTDSYKSYPLNLDYIAHFLKSWGIVGIKRPMNQTIGGKKIKPQDVRVNCYFIIDTYTVNTRSAKAKMIADIMDNYSEIIDLLGDFNAKGNDVMETLLEPNPENIIDTLQNNKKFAHLFKASTGTWEDFSVGEHTETCLRIFDKGIASEMPKELHPYMRLAIICHDIGKGMPKENNNTQLDNNIKYARQFMNELGIPKKIIEIVCTIITAQKYTSDYYISGDKNAEKSLFLYLTSQLQEIYKIAPSDEMVNGLMSMCKALQVCDSGAYTRYGVTRDKKTGIYYKNGNDDFTDSFEDPVDITHDRLRFKNDPSL